MTITAEDWVRRIEEVLDKFNLSKEEIRAFLWWAREMC